MAPDKVRAVRADAVSVMSANLNCMKVNANRDVAPAARISPPRRNEGDKSALTEPNFAASAQLTQKLSATPAVRAEAVARAKALIADRNYPGPEVIQKVARGLADKIAPRPNESR